jgi:hypothetical protein
MDDNEKFEREWRELLIKRLSSTRAALKRDAAAERKAFADARKLAAGYNTVEEAHEAFGWAYITEKQFDSIKAILEQDPNAGNTAHAALLKISSYIQALKDDIIQPQADRDYEAKMKDYFARIEGEGERDVRY